MLAEVRRVLRPGGWFAVDTPNARVTRLQQAELIDPDHEVEYTHAEMATKLAGAGLEVVAATGIGWAGPCLEAGRFVAEEVAQRFGLFSAADECYLLAYLCRKPPDDT